MLENVFLTASNLLYMSSYVVRDMLWLRILTIAAIGLLMPFYGLNQLWEAVAWEGVFMVINIYQTAVLIGERRPVKLSEDEQALRELAFPRLSSPEYRSLMSIAEWKECDKGDTLLEEDTVFSSLMVLFRGRLDVEKGGRRLAELLPGRFVGEMSFITGEATTAAVRAAEPVRFVSWSSERLEKLLSKKPDLRTALQLIIAKDLATKLAKGGDEVLVDPKHYAVAWAPA